MKTLCRDDCDVKRLRFLPGAKPLVKCQRELRRHVPAGSNRVAGGSETVLASASVTLRHATVKMLASSRPTRIGGSQRR